MISKAVKKRLLVIGCWSLVIVHDIIFRVQVPATNNQQPAPPPARKTALLAYNIL